jgi:hypothetical protein
MATITVSGTRSQTPGGPSAVSAPSGSINLNSTITNISGQLNVGNSSNIGGSVSVGGNLYVTGSSSLTNQVTILSTITSVSTNTGALVVGGGVGIGENLNVGGNAVITGTVVVYNNASITGTITVVGSTATVIIKANDNNVGNPLGVEYTTTNVYGTIDQRLAGAVYVGGGVGIEKDLNVGGYIYGRVAKSDQTAQTLVTSTNVDEVFYPTFVSKLGISTATFSYTYIDNINTGTGGTTSTGGLTYNPYSGLLTTFNESITGLQNSTGSDNGAFTVAGGVGIAKDAHIGGKAYVAELITNLISSKTGPISIKPEGNETDIYGELHVRGGKKPLGTAPVVTNVLYVTMDGDDTNDGRAMDPSRACRTVGGAMKSAYYQPGTQIRVSPGHYFEDNPLPMKPYTSVMGSDIRTTELEPINKTQDLFHVNSGCYLAFMQFCQGRSGLLPGDYYTSETNRGAYATAFPPQSGEDRIDLFHSPYIQNCTNLSGPWLKDGSLFQPNGTVQVPIAIGTATWVANDTSILVTLNTSLSTSTVLQGMSVNQGQQNLGFFNARSLLLANKPFLQSQIVSFVDQTFNSGSFVYNATSCRRDLALIVDSVALDLLHNSTSESIFAGLQYWNQNGYTGSILNQLTTTTAAISYVKSLAYSVVNAIDAASALIVDADFQVILDIINNGTAGVSNIIVTNGEKTTDATLLNCYNALIAAKTTIASQTVAWITANNPTFTFNTSTCYRDVQYMIDSVAFDLSRPNNTSGAPSNKQAIKSGVYYYNFDSTSTAVPNEVPQVVAAYNYLRSIIPNIVTGVELPKKYSLSTQSTTGYTSATIYESGLIQDKLDIITNIIRNGPSAVSDKIPMPLTQSNNIVFLNAYRLLEANITFLQDEIIAYIDSQFNNFDYNRQICYRDVGILVENVSYDATFGGNEKSIEAGLAYWNGAISKISGQVTQTISAIDYLNSLCQQVITNTTCTVLSPVTGIKSGVQVINTVLTGGEVSSTSIGNLFNIITRLIQTGSGDEFTKQGSSAIDAAYLSAEVLMQANRAFIQEDTINWINNNYQTFPYNAIKCKRDISIIIDSAVEDILFPTPEYSQSTFAGLQYYIQGDLVGLIPDQYHQTVQAVEYLKELSAKVIQNITPADDLVARYQTTEPQVTNLEPGTYAEAKKIMVNYDIIIEILKGNITGWTDKIIFGFTPSKFLSTQNAYAVLQANSTYLAKEVVAYINATNPGFDVTYDNAKCERDVGYMNTSICFDLLYGGNKQSIQSGLSYYRFLGSKSNIVNETTATIAAFNYLSGITSDIIQNITITPLQTTVPQVITTNSSTVGVANLFAQAISTVTDIISNGTTVAANRLVPISLTRSSTTATLTGVDNILANKDFLKAEVIAYINQTFEGPSSFFYDQELCYRDTGLIIDAVSQDILLGGNQKSIEAGLAYWNQDYNYVTGQETTTTAAINHARDIALQIIANQPVTPQLQTESKQIINTFYDYGQDYMPQEAIRRNFGIITNIIENGPLYAPSIYPGSALANTTGLNALDVQIAPLVTSVRLVNTATNTYLIGLDTPTVGFANNATLYFGEISIFPMQDYQVEALSLEYTGSANTWDMRKVDPIGGMGGSLVDGAVISDRSPINSFVYDAFTQLTQGGRGVRITNNGYAQLVSVFTIFSSVGVQVDNGGIASIVNSNANFGDLCLVAKGYGTRKFSGTVYNPKYKAYPDSPGVDGFNQYYPNGFWPNNAQVEIFVPDLDNRPHISLVMEVIPEEGHINEQGFPGFLTAQPNLATLTTGSITITGIDTAGISVGNFVYVRDQFASTFDKFPYVHDQIGNYLDINGDITTDPAQYIINANYGIPYIATGTYVTNVSYQSVTLNYALPTGGGFPDNDNYFTFFFCGNAYYTVLSSSVANNPKIPDTNIIGTANTSTDQVAAHIDSLQYLNSIVDKVIGNVAVSQQTLNTNSIQTFLPLVVGGADAAPFIDLRFGEMTSIIGATPSTYATVVPPKLIKKTGTVPAGSGNAIALINANKTFLADQVTAYVMNVYRNPGTFDYEEDKCRRDVFLILQELIYDLESGGNYHSVFSGLSYWSRNGTHHIVQLGENVTRSDLFPDGATVNFYQRSYISASGYVFEYVGAGTNYGALPQFGVADPVQGKEVVQLDNGAVFFTSTDQNGDFRIGPGLVISQATGVLSGRTFTKSLFANMTPFILAIEGGGGF